MQSATASSFGSAACLDLPRSVIQPVEQAAGVELLSQPPAGRALARAASAGSTPKSPAVKRRKGKRDAMGQEVSGEVLEARVQASATLKQASTTYCTGHKNPQHALEVLRTRGALDDKDWERLGPMMEGFQRHAAEIRELAGGVGQWRAENLPSSTPRL